MARPANPAGRALLRGAEDDDDEDQRGDELKQDCGSHVVAALVAGAPAILAKAADGKVIAAGHTARNDGQHPRGDDGAGELAEPVSDHILCRHATGGPDAQAYCRVDVAAGDGPNAIRRGDQPQAKCKGDAQNSHFVACDDGCSNAKEHQDKGAHKVPPGFSFSCFPPDLF